MNIVLDTNVWISGIFWSGPPNIILQAAESGILTIFTTTEILSELAGVLKREKFTPLFQSRNVSYSEVMTLVISLA